MELSAQQRTVSGTVVDDSGAPVTGALVSVTGDGQRVAITDGDGAFSLPAATNETITVTYLGYLDAVVPAAQTQILVTLQPDANTLEEVVVVGYGAQRKATLTGAVSAVNNKEITVTKNENVLNMIAGKIPGVRIMQTSAQPGKFDDVKMDIRGMGAPLVVVDGIQRDQNYFARMDANEIDQVSVLKDASAAIYGVQAANGVVLVTTKRGTASDGKFNINFSANYGVQNFLYLPETASVADHMLLFNELTFNRLGDNYPNRTTAEFTWQEMLEYSTGAKPSTNWSDVLFRKNVPQQSYNVSLDGGSEKVNYFFNVGYLDQQGSYKTGSLNYHRWNFRNNTDVKITNRLKASVQLSGYMGERNEPLTEIHYVYKKAWTYTGMSQPWIDGDHSMPAWDRRMLEAENPAAAIDSDITGFRQYKDINFDGTLSLDYEIPGIKGLNARASYGYTYYTQDNTMYERQYKYYVAEADGSITTRTQHEEPNLRREDRPGHNEWLLLSLNYANSFGDHNVGGMLAWEERYGFENGFWTQWVMNVDNIYPANAELKGVTAGQNGLNEWTKKALVGRFTYNYKERYLAEVTFRNDGSSNFPLLGTWGFFPSALVGWRISEEPWMKEAVPFLNNLKLRASWGKMGDDGNVSRQVVGYSMASDDVGWIYGSSVIGGVKTNPIPSNIVTWYNATTTNIGLDFDLWNGKLSGTFELFQRRRSGLLRDAQDVLPIEAGVKLDKVNTDSDKTFGYEILLEHRNTVGEVRYWASAQMSAAKNRWISYLDTPGRNSMINWRDKANSSGRNKDIWWVNEEEGGRFTSYDDIRWHNLPVDQNALPGDYWYEDWNGDGVIDGNDKHPVANYNLPVFNFGLTLGASWKGVDLAMNWAGSAGVYNQYDEVFAQVFPFSGGALLDIYKDRWHTVNLDDDPWNPTTQWIEGKYPATGHGFNTGTTGIHNTSFIRLKTLEVGYTLPTSWLEKLSVKELRVYVNAYNLLTFTKNNDIDPERPGQRGSANSDGSSGVLFYNYPINRTFNFGASLKF
jgi:TonB-linked SusC/RagA family outer membrane protein